MEKNNLLDNLRHSCAHLLAAAVMELWPDVKRTIGPPIENGFYYDFDFGINKISESDLPKIETKMKEILKSWKEFAKKEVTIDEAKTEFKNNEYKLELIEEFSKGEKVLTFYKSGTYVDLCRGGHVPYPNNNLKHFKLLKIAGAYWRGNEKNKMLTRIYGTCFKTKDDLEKYIWLLEQAKLRDHRKLGRELDLFIVSEQIGGGFPIFTPKGTIIREQITNYLTGLKKENGYQFVWTPHVAKSDIYHTSGHWGKYDAMFSPMKIEDDEYVVKPMNCPHHFQVYLSRPRSYKELPFRIAENGTCYRHEKSGELNGLLRVRSLTIDDTHTFIRLNQTYEELNRVLTLIKTVLTRLGFTDYKARISISDPANPQKYLGKPQEWKKAEEALKKAATEIGFDFEIGIGEAAFYGPKIDIMVKDSLHRSWQLSTVQLDYNQPFNFKMKYTDEKGEESYPAILHIAMIGSLERLIGVLIEHYAGKFPLWLSPVQLLLVPIAERHLEATSEIASFYKQKNIRVEIDDRQETMQAKIRAGALQKVPYIGIIGDKEIEDKNKLSLSVRTRDGSDLGKHELSQFLNIIEKEVETKN